MTRKELTAACLMSTAGAIIYLIAPVLVGSAMDSLGLSSDEAGLLIAAYFGGYTVITVSAVLWLSRVNMRKTAWMSSIVLVLGLLIATMQTTLTGSVVAMFVAGTGAGMLYGIAITVIGQSDDPDRYFGFALAAQLLLGSGLLFAGPAWIGPNWGYDGILIATALFVLLMSLTDNWTPEAIAEGPVTAGGSRIQLPISMVLIGVAAVLVWFTGYSGVYAFIERIGVNGGLSGHQIGLVLSLTIITGISGAMSAAWLGDRIGKLVPHFIGAAGTGLTILLLSGQPELVRFSAAIVCLTFSLNFWLAYMLGGVGAIDTTGRFAVLTTAALGIGAMLGPSIGGALITETEFTPLFSFAAICIVAGLALIVGVLKRFVGYSASPAQQEAS